MDRYQGAARLEWWANRSTCLGAVAVEVDVVWSAEGSWEATAVLTPPLTGEDLEGFEFLMTMSPFFTLRFPDESTFPVGVEAVADGLRLRPDEGDTPKLALAHFDVG
jgi:hypothetical protein